MESASYIDLKSFCIFWFSDLSDLVCIIGMVNVKVLGSVENGERLYSSLEHPGVAIPQSRLCDAVSKDAFLLGQTLEGSDANTSNIHLVQSFVSALLSITNGHLADAFDDVRKHLKEDVKTEVKAVKKKCLRGNLVATVTFLKTVIEKAHLIWTSMY